MALCGLPLVAARWGWLLFAAVEGLWNVWISVVACMILAAPRQAESSWIRDQAWVLYIGRWTPILCATREVWSDPFFFSLLHSRWDLSFPTRNWTNAPDLEAWNQPLDHLGEVPDPLLLLPPLRLWLSLVCKVRTHAHLSLIFKPCKVKSTLWNKCKTP